MPAKLRLLLVTLLLLCAPRAHAVQLTGEEDGTPDHNSNACWAYKFANNNVTVNADGTCSIADQTGAGGGDPILIGGSAIGDAAGVDLIGGTGIDIALDAGVSPDTATFNIDLTELTGNRTWGDGSDASIALTFNLSGTDPVLTFSSGALALTGNLSATNLSGTNTGDQTTISGNAGTATALAADPANCASSGLAGGITAAGTAEACITPHAGTNIAADLEEEGAINATAVTGNVADTQLLVGTGASTAGWVTMSGDATISNLGVLAVAANAVALTTDTTGNYAAGDAEAGNALTGDSATSFFSAGTIEDARLPGTMDSKTFTTYLIIPTGASPTVDAAGKIAEDTTDTQLQWGAANTMPATVRECHTFENLVAADDNKLFMVARNDLTAVASHCRTSGFTTQPTIVWEDGTGNAMTGSPTCNGTESQAVTAISSAGAVTANEAIRFDNTATSAPITGTTTTLCIDYTWTRK